MKQYRVGKSRKSSIRRRRSRIWRVLGRRRGRRVRTSRYQVAVPVWQQEAKRSLAPPWLISALLLVVLGWFLYWFATADIFYISDLQIKGSWRLSEAELMKISGLEGLHVFWVNTRAAEEAIEALPDIESARVRCGLPADCVVQLVERPALIVWRQGDAQVWIGENGVVLPARSDLPNAIVLDAAGSTALMPGDQFDPTLVTAVEVLTRRQPQVRTYQYSDEYGLSFRNEFGWLMRLGDGREIETKMDLIDAIASHLMGKGIEPAFVDVRFPEAPYYRE